MRNHGWHLPYHPLQIVAVAVFSALAFSFYVFFVPFVGSSVVRYHVIAAFSPLVFAVFILYVRCAAIDPADSGIRAATQRTAATKKLESSAEILLHGSETHKNTADQVEIDLSGSTHLSPAPETDGWEKTENVCSFLSCPVVVLWRCLPGTGLLGRFFLGKKTNQERYIPEEELLYCSLCEAEILKSSKHCRACDKCVDGFDHHCRWLNNCIGKKNYKTFIAVMVASLLMLVLEWSIGISVLVRCFSDKHKFDKEITEKLGSSFTRIPFVVVVTLCTFLALLATLPLTQLLFFHIILIKKGITTYDYIVAIREQETQDPPFEGHLGRSPSSSPTSSVVTAMSGGSSSGGLHRAVWCTPPRIFVENQANMKSEVVAQYATPLRVFSLQPSLRRDVRSVKRPPFCGLWPRLSPSKRLFLCHSGGDLPLHLGPFPRTDLGNDGGISSRHLKEGLGTQPKRQIGLSPWKLARLSGKDAARAAIRARENSSILRPVKCMDSPVITETEDSSFESSAEISTAHGGHKVGWRLEVPLSQDLQELGHEHQNPLYNVELSTDVQNGRLRQHFDGENGHAINPLGSEARSPFRSRSLNTLTSTPVSASATESPDNLGSPDLACGDLRHQNVTSQERSCLYRATSDGYEASGGESADDTSDQGHRLSQAWSKLKLNPSFFGRGDKQNATIKWNSDSEDVVTLQSQLDSRASSACETRSNGSRVEANILRHVKKDWPGIRDKISTSTDGSYNSSPSYLVSPIQGMSPDIQSAFEINFSSPLEQSSSRESGANIYEVPLAGESFKPMTGKRGSSSAKGLKESLLSFRRGLSSSPAGGALLSSTP